MEIYLKSIVKELDLNIDHKRLIGLDNQKVINNIYYIQTLNNLTMRWKAWMRRFYGVATILTLGVWSIILLGLSSWKTIKLTKIVVGLMKLPHKTNTEMAQSLKSTCFLVKNFYSSYTL